MEDTTKDSYFTAAYRKRKKDLAMSAKELCAAYALPYEAIRKMTKTPSFPYTPGTKMIIPSDFDRWRREQNKARQRDQTPNEDHQPQGEDKSYGPSQTNGSLASLPPHALRLLESIS